MSSPPPPPPAPAPLILPSTTSSSPSSILPPPPILKVPSTPTTNPEPCNCTTNPTPQPHAQTPRSYLLTLLIYNGHPFKDHWAYFIPSHRNPSLGVEIHATGDVRAGFEFQIKRAFDLRERENVPAKIVRLGWVCGGWFRCHYRDHCGDSGGGKEIHGDWGKNEDDDAAEQRMLNNGIFKLDDTPVCAFERILKGVEVPGKTLVSIEETTSEESARKKIVQRNCQTWIIESAAQLVKEGILDEEVLLYLRAIEK